jgi:hypothetical protein
VAVGRALQPSDMRVLLVRPVFTLLLLHIVVVKCIFLLKCDTVYKLLRKFTKYVQNMRKSKLLLRSLLNCSNVERAHRNRYRLVWQSINHIVCCVVPEHRYAVRNWQLTNFNSNFTFLQSSVLA